MGGFLLHRHLDIDFFFFLIGWELVKKVVNLGGMLQACRSARRRLEGIRRSRPMPRTDRRGGWGVEQHSGPTADPRPRRPRRGAVPPTTAPNVAREGWRRAARAPVPPSKEPERERKKEFRPRRRRRAERRDRSDRRSATAGAGARVPIGGQEGEWEWSGVEQWSTGVTKEWTGEERKRDPVLDSGRVELDDGWAAERRGLRSSGLGREGGNVRS